MSYPPITRQLQALVDTVRNLEDYGAQQATLATQSLQRQFEVENQRDDLLAALQGILAVASIRIDDPRIEQWDAARRAISKATGETK